MNRNAQGGTGIPPANSSSVLSTPFLCSKATLDNWTAAMAALFWAVIVYDYNKYSSYVWKHVW